MPVKSAPKVAPKPVAAPPVEAPETPAAALGISEEAFKAAGVALDGIAEGGLGEEGLELPASEGGLPPASAPAPVASEVAPPAPKPPEENVPKGWAAVKKAEQLASQNAAILRRKMQDLERREAEFEKRNKSQLDIISELKKDPRALEKHGLSLQEFLDRIINDNAATPATARRESSEENSELRKEIKELKQLFMQDRVQSAEEKFLNRFDGALQKPEFELLRDYPDAKAAAIRFAGEYYQAHGKMDLTPDQIARHLQDTWQEHLNSLRSAKAVRKVLGLPDEQDSQESEESEPESEAPPRRSVAPKAKPRTVTPNMASSPARGTPPAPRGKQSDEDILREAAKLVPKDIWDQMG
jgi:hypothetical protein